MNKDIELLKNINKKIPVIILNKAPMPNFHEQVILITKDNSIVSFKYSELFCFDKIIIALKKKNNIDKYDFSQNFKDETIFEIETQNDEYDNFEYSGVLCKVLDKIFDNSENINKMKLKVLVKAETRVRFNEMDIKNFIYRNINIYGSDKFENNNIVFKKKEINYNVNSKEELNQKDHFIYLVNLGVNNIENFTYLPKTLNNTDDYQDENLKDINFDLNNAINDNYIIYEKKYEIIESKFLNLIKIFKNYSILYNFKINYDNIFNNNEYNQIKKIDLIASRFDLNYDELFKLFVQFNPNDRIDSIIGIIKKEELKYHIEDKIENNVKESIEKTQKIYLLNEKGKEISKQLDELNGEVSDFDSMEEKLEKMNLAENIKKKLRSEIKRLKVMNQSSSDASLIRNYLDWVFDIPFGIYSELNINFASVTQILNEEHYGMDNVKERILQYLAVDFRGGCTSKSALLLIGPPGVGKTSLSRKIAQALGRKFIRISLGGISYESDIRGHRRTYLGSMPGKIMQAIRDCESANPLILLDEIDKIGHDFRGDPASALLEVLDREQNNEFLDHYIDIPFDLSKVLFICTANGIDGISRPLYDRTEVIWLSSYSDDEKIQIAMNYMIPEQQKSHNLTKDEIIFENDIISLIVKDYTYEAGVRGLEEQISIIMRKVLLKILNENASLPIIINKENLKDFLGFPRFIKFEDITLSGKIYGIANGLAWNEAGGSVLTIECVSISLKDEIKIKFNDDEVGDEEKTKKKSLKKTSKNNEEELINNTIVKLTGKLGDVMQESIQTAFSYIKANREDFGISSYSYNSKEIHIHVPEGATPKDGPSAGITIFSALISLLSKKPLKPSFAMTGEITLTGRILPIGGLKEKILAAKKHGIKNIIIPAKNKRDLEELPAILKDGLNIYLINDAKEALKLLFD